MLGVIATRVDAGAALDEAIRQEVPKSRRSWVIHHWASFRREGFEALIDERVPREPKVAKESGSLIETARDANSKVTVVDVWGILQRQKVSVLRVLPASVRRGKTGAQRGRRQPSASPVAPDAANRTALPLHTAQSRRQRRTEAEAGVGWHKWFSSREAASAPGDVANADAGAQRGGSAPARKPASLAR